MTEFNASESWFVSGRCDCGCQRTIVMPVGVGDPKQLTCGHVFKLNDWNGSLECVCGLKINMETLMATGFVQRNSRYDNHANHLRDELGRANGEIRELKVENCDLRRKCERLERK